MARIPEHLSVGTVISVLNAVAEGDSLGIYDNVLPDTIAHCMLSCS